MYIEAARRNSLAPSISEARLSALTARIRPHFLFNSLNAAISLIRLRPYDAETLLENLANLFRAQLRDGSQNSTLGQEIEWAQEYIAIEQIRMGHMRVQVCGNIMRPTMQKRRICCYNRFWKMPYSMVSNLSTVQG